MKTQQTIEHTPAGLWEALWPVIAPAISPELVGGLALVIAISQAVKVHAAALRPELAAEPTRWKAFRSAVSMASGATVGLVLWLAADLGPVAVVALACGSGPLWALVISLLPRRVGWALMTDPDRKWHNPPGPPA